MKPAFSKFLAISVGELNVGYPDKPRDSPPNTVSWLMNAISDSFASFLKLVYIFEKSYVPSSCSASLYTVSCIRLSPTPIKETTVSSLVFVSGVVPVLSFGSGLENKPTMK